MAPTLSSVRSYDPHWLLDDAAHSRRVANGWTDGWQSAYQNVAGLPWTGVGREAALRAHGSGLTQAQTHASTLTASAASTEATYHELINEKNALLRQVDEIQGEGYQVAEDFLVTPGPKMKGAEALLRVPDMAQKTAALTEAAGQLFAHDAAAGAQVAAPAATFADVPFTTLPHTIVPVDNGTPDLPAPVQPPIQPQNLGELLGAGAPTNPGLDNYLGSLSAVSAQPAPPVQPPMPTSRPPGVPRGVPIPPMMTKPPADDGYWNPGPEPGWTEENPKTGPVLGGVVTGATLGCETGAGWAAAIAAPALPAEIIAPELGCVAGGVIGAIPPLAYPWVDNVIEGGG